MDCEGCEDAGLESASQQTLQKIRVLALEYHEFAVPGVARRLPTILENAGFVVQVVPNRHDDTIGFVFAHR